MFLVYSSVYVAKLAIEGYKAKNDTRLRCETYAERFPIYNSYMEVVKSPDECYKKYYCERQDGTYTVFKIQD